MIPPTTTRATRSLLLAAVAVAALSAAPATAQEPRDHRPRKQRASTVASTAVHEAWLKEVLDLAPREAEIAYDRIQKRVPRKEPIRWIAVTRLAELGRLGVTSEPSTVPTGPEAVRKAFEQLATPVPWLSLLSDPVAELELPPLRPATRQVQDWVRNQISPSIEDRLRRRPRPRREPSNAARQRWFASDVLERELEGRRSQAAGLRKIRFTHWEPPEVDEAPETLLPKVRERLATWIAEEQSSWHRSLLRTLEQGLQEQASPRAAIEFVQRLPYYSERLLLAPKSGDDEKR